MSPALAPPGGIGPADRVGCETSSVAAPVLAGAPGGGRIGPNAVVRLGEAVTAVLGAGASARLFEDAGLACHLAHPPTAMVDEREVTRLHAALRDRVGVDTARRVSREAGRLTADYLLRHRIPRAMRYLLPKLPAALASRILLAAIARHAWTFVGSGTFDGRHGQAVRCRIGDCPVCRGAASAVPLCDYYAGTFERLHRVLVHPDAQCTELTCVAAGDAFCDFEIRWR